MRQLLLQNSNPVVRRGDVTQYLAADSNGRVQYTSQSLPPPFVNGFYLTGLADESNFSGVGLWPPTRAGTLTWESATQRALMRMNTESGGALAGNPNNSTVVALGGALDSEPSTTTAVANTLVETAFDISFASATVGVVRGQAPPTHGVRPLYVGGRPRRHVPRKGRSATVATYAVGAASANATWRIEAIIGCRLDGAAGTVRGSGFYTDGVTHITNRVLSVGVNTTIANTVSLTCQWGVAAAGNSASMDDWLLEAVN
jgi:hypothetical protein